MKRYLSIMIMIFLSISCTKDKNNDFQYLNEYNGTEGSIKSVFWTSDDTNYDIYLCLDETANLSDLFAGDGKSTNYLLVSVDKQFVGRTSDLKKETASFMIADHTNAPAFSDIKQGYTEAISSGSVELKSVSESVEIRISIKSASQPQRELTLSYSGAALKCEHGWNPNELPSKFSYNKVSHIGSVLYDAAAIDDNIYYFYENTNAASTDTPILEIHLPEKIAVDGAPIVFETISSVKLSDGTELSKGAMGTLSILRGEDEIAVKISGKTAGSGKPFSLRYKGSYGVWFPEQRTLNNEFSLSERNPSKILSVFAQNSSSAGISIFFCRKILTEIPIFSLAPYEAIELRVPNTIWDGEAKNLNDVAKWHIRYGQALDNIHGYLFVNQVEAGANGTVTLKRDGDEIEVTFDVQMAGRDEKYNPALQHPQIQLHYKGAVLEDTYGLSNQMAVGSAISNIGSVLMDKTDELLYQIYLCENAGIKQAANIEGKYMKFVIASSKLTGTDPKGIKLSASDCNAIVYNGTSLAQTTGSVTVFPEPGAGKVRFAADINSGSVRYKVEYIGEYTLPDAPNSYTLDPANYVYYSTAVDNRTTFYVSELAESYDDIKKYPYSVVTVDNELINADEITLEATDKYFSIEYYESDKKLFFCVERAAKRGDRFNDNSVE